MVLGSDCGSSFSGIADEEVLRRFGEIVARDREVTAEVLAHVGELDERKVWAREAFPSMFAMCLERFGMSESMAGKRIHAARAARAHPEMLAMVRTGELHVTGINRLAPALTQDNAAEALRRARRKTVREIEELVAELVPEPDVPARIRKLPARERAPARPKKKESESAESYGSGESDAPSGVREASEADAGPDAAGAPSGVREASEADAGPHAAGAPSADANAAASASDVRSTRRTSRRATSPLSPGRYKLQLTIGTETRDKLERLRALMPELEMSEIVDRALGGLIERTLVSKAALTGSPREGRSSGRRTRAVPAAVRREVWLRDGGQCSFVGDNGHRCKETRGLEFHHEAPWARGGEHDASTMSLRCRAHNQYQADLDYGRGFMDARRRAPRG